VSYTDAELTEDAPSLNAEKGDKLPGSSAVNFNAGLEYGFDLVSLPSYARLDWIYTGKQRQSVAVQDAPFYGGDFHIVNLALGTQVDRLGINLFARNLFDEYAFTTVTNAAVGFAIPVRPRTIGVNVDYRF
jgi:outer membrane receptor protein involved in Fe transport